ncbi:hypothetical protein MAR_010911 [Mya arenaria]|uniref:Uncharacterized protein n=1 Tax=Mya arenaria TaxID=6604 RepID=A0ABY7FSS3_MYAAR|nr:hypothetical protein MAR_010911 [Mya arenaria]
MVEFNDTCIFEKKKSIRKNNHMNLCRNKISLKRLSSIDEVDDDVQVHRMEEILLHTDESHQLAVGNDQCKHQVLKCK